MILREGAMNAGTYFFSFSGRVNRAGYWTFVAVAVFYALSLAGVVFQIIVKNVADSMISVLFLEVGIFAVPLIVSGLAVSARRLHDCDLSAWWLVVFVIAPGVLAGLGGVVMGQAGMHTVVSVGLELISTVISTWSFVQLGCLRGTIGPNRFGPDPLRLA
jgi:uncharacterized membrane protein YhaH (DUF805 family)